MKTDYKKNSLLFSPKEWMVPVGLAVILIIVSQFNFLLFHTLAELFAIIIAVIMCVVAWQMYAFTRNNYLMFLGVGYFWIAVLDLMHALSYKGINVFPYSGGGLSTQFWIVTRFLEASLLLLAPWFLSHSLRYKTAFGLFGIATVLICLMILNGYFPEAYVEGKGLTSFKIYGEYLIIAILGLAIIYLSRRSRFIDDRIKNIIILSITLTMFAELFFTFYVGVYDLSNMFGHIFKLFSFWLIFKAMIGKTLQEPFHVMARDSSTYDAMPDATIMVDDGGIILQANQAACELVKLNKNELIGESSHQLFHPADMGYENCPVCESSSKGEKIQSYEAEDRKNNRWLDFTLSPVPGLTENGGTVQVIRDITSRKQVEQKLDEVNHLKNSIVENLPAMLFVKRAEDHCYVEWNKEAEEVTGLKREEMLGKTDFDFFTEEEAEFYTNMDKKVIAEGRLYDIPEETIHTKYKGIRILHTRKIPIFSRLDQASYLLGISQDITEQRENEEVLRRSQKMEAVGQLSGGIAHDFNNQLGIVTGYLEFLKEFVKNEEKQSKWVESARKAALRCVELTRQMLAFSRTKSPEKEPVDINNIIIDIEDIIEKSVTPQFKINFQLESDIWPVVLDKSEFEDVIINMVINARDAMKHGGDIVIRSSNVYLDDEVLIQNRDMRPGEYVMLEIKDSGCGMSKEVIEHVFEPFFTTKPVGSGTGLGLSMVYAFVQRYDGTIKIDSVIGAGSSIKMYLPRDITEEIIEGTEIKPEHVMVLPTGEETILIVDDELDLLNLTAEYIESLGYKIFKAASAREALSILESEKVDLVLSDVVMPGGLNGYDLAAVVKKDHVGVKVILTSGYVGNSPSSGYKGIIVSKPYTRQDIAHQVRLELDDTGK